MGHHRDLFVALDGVTRAFITAGQDFVQAVLSLNLSNIVNSLINGTQLVINAAVAGAGDIVNGIVFAQDTIAAALATPAPMVALARRTAAGTTPAVSALPNPGGSTTVTVETATAKPGHRLAATISLDLSCDR